MNDKALAATINAAIDEMLKLGPAASTLGLWRDTLEQILDQAAPPAPEGAAAVKHYCQRYFNQVVQARGLTVRSIAHSDGAAARRSPEHSTAIIGPSTFERLEPKIRSTFAACVKEAQEQAEPFRRSELQKALAAFEQWAKSIPLGGTKDRAYREAARDVRQALKAFPQWDKAYCGHKAYNFPTAVSRLFSEGSGGASPQGTQYAGPIAAIWRWGAWTHETEHERFNGRAFVVRGNWAITKGFINQSVAMYTDQMPHPGDDNCRCHYQYLYSLRDLPPELLSREGKEALAKAKAVTDAIRKGEPIPEQKAGIENTSAAQRLFSAFKKLI